uniref:Putative secreted protein n=1 Tax=Ixodes ricinus TaxID=34613 RepID=A0A6B0U7E0_IXORI
MAAVSTVPPLTSLSACFSTLFCLSERRANTLKSSGSPPVSEFFGRMLRVKGRGRMSSRLGGLPVMSEADLDRSFANCWP